jgi:hypothetical protein
MEASKWKKPATAPHGEPALGFERIAGPLSNSHTTPIANIQDSIRCELTGNDVAMAGDIKASGALELCRRLLAAGANPAAELVCYRNHTLALRVKSIRAGAKLTVQETASGGPRFATWRPFPAVRSERPFDKTQTRHIGSPEPTLSTARGDPS